MENYRFTQFQQSGEDKIITHLVCAQNEEDAQQFITDIFGDSEVFVNEDLPELCNATLNHLPQERRVFFISNDIFRKIVQLLNSEANRIADTIISQNNSSRYMATRLFRITTLQQVINESWEIRMDPNGLHITHDMFRSLLEAFLSQSIRDTFLEKVQRLHLLSQ